ncbi:MAG: DUF2155 domain-containing protein [Rhodopseudomonas palustris]|nr:MAG: DUF2155 domain-containing protein [Rhodopseudomonas palustris]
MLRFFGIAGLAALLAAPMMLSATPASAQIGTIFSDPPLRPPGNVPRGGAYEDEEEVPDLPPQGRLLPTPNRPLPGQGQGQGPGQSALPGPVQSQPLPPPPGAALPPPQTAPNAAVPPAATVPPPAPGVAAAPPSGAAQPQPKTTAPPVPATLQPGDEVVTEPPAQKIVNKKAVFSGLDKITGRIINFDVDIGETVQFGALRVKTDACYTRPSTESANTDAFVEVDEITLQGEVKRIFSGWMFAASPGLHGVEHPIYDIWLTDCKAPETTVAAGQADAQPKPAPPPPAQKRAPPKPRPQPQVYPPQQQAPTTYPPPYR